MSSTLRKSTAWCAKAEPTPELDIVFTARRQGWSRWLWRCCCCIRTS